MPGKELKQFAWHHISDMQKSPNLKCSHVFAFFGTLPISSTDETLQVSPYTCSSASNGHIRRHLSSNQLLRVRSAHRTTFHVITINIQPPGTARKDASATLPSISSLQFLRALSRNALMLRHILPKQPPKQLKQPSKSFFLTMATNLPPLKDIEQLSPLVTRILGGNPGKVP